MQTAGITATDGFAGNAGASASWIQFVDRHILGDVNEDGRLNITDIVALSKYISDGDSTHIQISKADLTGDGRITVADIVELARRIANQ